MKAQGGPWPCYHTVPYTPSKTATGGACAPPSYGYPRRRHSLPISPAAPPKPKNLMEMVFHGQAGPLHPSVAVPAAAAPRLEIKVHSVPAQLDCEKR